MKTSAIMELTNLHPDEHVPLFVLPLGFDSTAIEKINNVFQLSRSSNRSYVITQNADAKVSILLVNYDNPIAIQQQEQLLAHECQFAQVVALSHGPLADAPTHHIRGMLTAVRLLSLLDTLTFEVQEPPRENTALTVSRTKGFRALVVDDSMAIQKSIELKLRELPEITEIDFADDGETALAKTAQQQYDLIFLDIMMPGIDGYQTCTEIRKMPSYKKTPIIMVSGKSSPLDEVKGIIAGSTTYLIKPIQEDAFHKLSVRVLTWLNEQRKVNETAAC